jgi:hypothetical protein
MEKFLDKWHDRRIKKIKQSIKEGLEQWKKKFNNK